MPNFFLVLSPGALDDYPATFIASMRVEDNQKTALVDLVREHPTISVIDLDSILQQVRSIIEKASLAVQAVFFFTLAAGIAVLFAAVQSTIDERRFESAMLRALGARRKIVFSGVMAEFAALGAAAGILASAGASPSTRCCGWPAWLPGCWSSVPAATLPHAAPSTRRRLTC
jgi:putative ABC transport system permease protein